MKSLLPEELHMPLVLKIDSIRERILWLINKYPPDFPGDIYYNQGCCV